MELSNEITNNIIELVATLKADMLNGQYGDVKNLATIATQYIEKNYGQEDTRIAFFATYYGDACFSLGEYDNALLSYNVAYKIHNKVNGQYDLETIKARIKKARVDIIKGKNKLVEKELADIKSLLLEISHGEQYLLNIEILYASLYLNLKQYNNAEDKLAEALKLSENMLAQKDIKEKYQIIDTMCGIYIKKALLFSLRHREYEMLQAAKLAINISANLYFSLAIVLPAISILCEYAKNHYDIKTKKQLEKHIIEKYHIALDNNMGIAFDKICKKTFNLT